MKKSNQLFLHLAFWVVLISSVLMPMLTHRIDDSPEVSLIVAYSRVFVILYFYLGFFFVMKLIRIKRVLWIPAILLLCAFVVLYIFSRSNFVLVTLLLKNFFIWFAIGSLFQFLSDWFLKKDKVAQLEKENAESQLAALRTQVNPHFLFNTLNNIDTLIHRDQKAASASLLKLSDIMRYMLKDTESEQVPLNKEIDYLENYIELERLRIKNEKFLSYTFLGDLGDRKIAPMLFIPFIENAFKHSVDSDIENGIVINISIEDDQVHFKCNNRYEINDIEKDEVSGIGLDNVTKRLALLYPKQHQLSIDDKDNVYTVNLKIDLNEN